ncbi:MAG: hypothetical protein AAFX52_15160 [Pseudomonadota bacterium]
MIYLKTAIYLTLIVNLGYYLHEDWSNSQHVLTESSTIVQFLGNYAATLDDLAWILLIFIFDIETYWLEDDFENRLIGAMIVLTKVVLYGLILQTTYSYIVAMIDWYRAVPIDDISDICALSGLDYSLLRNLRYTEITAETCGSIISDGQFFLAHNEPVVTDGAGRAEDKILRIVDIIENLSWLIIIAMTELALRIQNRGVYEGPFVGLTRNAKYLSYAAIVGASVYWAIKGHLVYAWDEFVWIAGFWMLENNLAMWRRDLKEASDREPGMEDVPT